MNFFGVIKKEAAVLPPSVFALVMSTGIVSIACNLLHLQKISHLLFFLNEIQFIVLLLLLSFRLVFFFSQLSHDLSSHAKGAGFLTIVAGACIIGLQFALLKEAFAPSVFLWFFSFIIWLIIMYAFFIAVIVKRQKPSLEKGMNGSWLLVVVSTQSLSILASTLQNHLPFPAEIITFFSLSTFLLGFILYVIIITLVFHRLIFFPLTPEEFTPPYWIDMGACAITTLAAATFITTNKGNALFNDLIPFLKTSAVLCWSVSTWWIPVIFILEIWRHVSKKFPLQYDSSYWSMVFPLGMYTVCTLKIAEALQFPFLQSIAKLFIYIAGIAWLITFVGMCFTIVKSMLFEKKVSE